jgi:hypothetical protein
MVNYADILIQIISSASEAIDSMSESEMDLKPNPDKWSKKEILGHLIDSTFNNHRRFLKAQSQDNLIFCGYDQELWVKKNNYQERDKEEILITWEIVNNHMDHMLRSIPESTMTQKTSNHNFHEICMKPLQKGESSSLSYLLWDYVYHMEHHLSQIIPGYQKLLKDYKGE